MIMAFQIYVFMYSSIKNEDKIDFAIKIVKSSCAEIRIKVTASKFPSTYWSIDFNVYNTVLVH